MPVSFARASIARTLALSTALGAATLLGAHAIAQTAPPSASQSAPASDAGARGSGADSEGRSGAGMGRMGRGDDERGWRRGEGRRGDGERRGRVSQLSEQDRQAMTSARLAAAKAVLMLTPEQEPLWAPLEAAIREGMKLRQDWRARAGKDGVAANPVERMRRMGEMASARGAAMTKLADAAAPLYKSLTDDQKRRLRFVHRMARGMAHEMGGAMGGGMMGLGMTGLGMMGGDGPRMGRDMGRDADGRRGEWRGRGGHYERHHDRHHRRGDDDRGRGRGDQRL